MGRKLNKVSDEIWKRELADHRETLALLAKGPRSDQPADVERWRHASGTRARQAGLVLHQQEGDPREVRALLRTAAEHLLGEHLERGLPAPNTDRRPRTFKLAIDLVVAFGTLDQRRALPAVKPWQIRNPVEPEDDAAAALASLLSGFAAGQPLDVAACRALEASLSADRTARWDRAFHLPCVRALRAIAEGDAGAWNQALAELVEAHEAESKRGEYRKSDLALMCLPALALAKLGRERGLTCTVRSEYLPLTLLEAAP